VKKTSAAVNIEVDDWTMFNPPWPPLGLPIAPAGIESAFGQQAEVERPCGRKGEIEEGGFQEEEDRGRCRAYWDTKW